MNDARYSGSDGSFEELEHLVGEIRGHGDTIRGYVETVARQHDDVQGMAERAQTTLALDMSVPVHEISGLKPSQHLARRGQDIFGLLDERLQRVEELVRSFPTLRAEMEALAETARSTSMRAETVSQKALFTFQRLGGAEGLDTLHQFPERVAREADAAIQRLNTATEQVERTIEERLSGLSEQKLRTIAHEAEQVLMLTQKRLDTLNGTITDAEQRLRTSWRNEQQAFSQTLQGAIAAHQEAAFAIEKALQQRLEAQEQAVQQAEATIRQHFQHHVLQAVGSQVVPRLAQWDQHVESTRDQISLHVEQFSREAEDKIMLLRSRMTQFEREAAFLHGQMDRFRQRAAAGAIVAVLIAVAVVFVYKNPAQPSDAPLLAPDVLDVPVAVEAYEPPPAPEEVIYADPVSRQEALPLEEPDPLWASGLPLDPAPETSPEAVSAGYVWVVASEADERIANELATMLTEAGVASRVYPASVGSETRYRVGAGFYADQRAAQAGKGDVSIWLPKDAWLLRVGVE